VSLSLSENEIRDIIRRRLVIEQLRYSKTQKMILFEQDGGVLDQARQAVAKKALENVSINNLLGSGEDAQASGLANLAYWALTLIGTGVSAYLLITLALSPISWTAYFAAVALPALIGWGTGLWIKVSSKQEAERIAKESIAPDAWGKYLTPFNPANEFEKTIKKSIQEKSFIAPSGGAGNEENIPVKPNDVIKVLDASNPKNLGIKKSDNAPDGVEIGDEEELKTKSKEIEKIIMRDMIEGKVTGNQDASLKPSSVENIDNFLGLDISSLEFGMTPEEIKDAAEEIVENMNGSNDSPNYSDIFEILSQCPMSYWDEIDLKVGQIVYDSLAEAGSTAKGTGIMDAAGKLFGGERNTYNGRYSEDYNLYFPDGTSPDTLDNMGSGQVDMIDTSWTSKNLNRYYSYQQLENDISGKGTKSIILKMIYAPDYASGDYKSYESVVDDLREAYVKKYGDGKYFHTLIRTQDPGKLLFSYAELTSGGQPNYAWEIKEGLLMGKGIGLDSRFFEELENLKPEKGIIERIQDYFGGVWDSVKNWFAGWGEFFGEKWGGFKENIVEIFDFDFKIFGEDGLIAKGYEAIVEFFKNPLSLIWGWFKKAVNWFWDKLLGLFGYAKKKVDGVVTYISGEEQSGDDRTEDEISRGTSQRGSRRTPKNSVREMQRNLNAIIDAENIEARPTNPDGIWGPDTDRVWSAVLKNEFKEVFPEDSDVTSFKDWPAMSEKLRDDKGKVYQDYTPDAQGALNIIMDIAKKKNISSNTGRDRTTGEFDRGVGSLGDDNDYERRVSGSGSSNAYNLGYDVMVSVDSGNNLDGKTLEQLGLPKGSSENVADAVARTIKSQNFTGGTVQLKIKYANKDHSGHKKGEIIKVALAPQQRGTKRLEMLNFSRLKSAVSNVLMSRAASGEQMIINTKPNRKDSSSKRRGFDNLGGNKGTFTLIIKIERSRK